MVVGDDGFDDSDVFPSEFKAQPEFLETFESQSIKGVDASSEGLEEAIKESRKPRPEPKPDWTATPQSRRIARKAAQDAAKVVVGVLNGLATTIAGHEAKMSSDEKEMIIDPLERLLMRVDIVSSGAMDKWADPIALIIGLTAWGSRVARVSKSNAPAQEEKKEEPVAENNQKVPRPEPAKPENLLMALMTSPEVISNQMFRE